ncbi:AAA family ATPase [Acidithiobacillus sp.]|uniref:AAA family ATPase n=1 Tax=Acidithiobacillus sp. TaxID=1872118 RepID=UPI002629F60C|nr:AAA family ATPase [Acidithiobacillus sp.]MDD2750108.1 AAA family ATPase [Acidithiobacillus sp.]MDD5280054.1 AAA family ATPase [Acidithiobacillus sp.]
MKHSSARYANYAFDFQRVNVILGANGSGKSKLLTEIKDQASAFTGGFKAVYIEGGRTIKIKDVLQLDHTNFGQFDRYESALSHYNSKRATSLADRVFDSLVVLDKRDANLKSQHSDAVDKWISEEQKGDVPRRAKPPLEHLFELFSEIFPQITLSYDTQGRRLSAQKHGQTYGPSSLSDGEKQVFSILADLIELDDSHKLIVADEPELNLHPELAERLWTLLENEFPDKTFVYATHSIGFALRGNVQSVWVLSSDAENIAEFSGLDSLPREETTAFLGGLPGILSANRVLVTEGHEKSFDAIFYRWILQDNKVEIYPGGGCGDVTAIVGKAGLWDKISSKIQLWGVVDADYRDDTYLDALRQDSIHVLKYHEAEAYLCIPEVLCAIANRIGSQDTPLTLEAVRSHIFTSLEAAKLSIAARRAFAKSRVALAVSLERKLLVATSSREELATKIREAAASELQKAESTISPDLVEATFNAEFTAIESAITASDIEVALRFLPAKELLNTLAPRAGCKNGSDLMRSLRRNFKPDEFAATKTLAADIATSAP